MVNKMLLNLSIFIGAPMLSLFIFSKGVFLINVVLVILMYVRFDVKRK
ncbi:hypothetical protein H4V97_001015 [Flavobacterium sp. CG_23.5]|nr:hypothetical protein [Flavobacterium sp. CG_9.10]MBP2282697.1 hypothetical protein [Flavobacterium sp. CG_23.5]